MKYSEFLEAKTHTAGAGGFDPVFMPDILFDFQRALVEWSVRIGRGAIFADCGLGKTPMQLTWAENVARHSGGRVLILTPLAVGAQTVREGEKFGVQCGRSRNGSLPAERIVVANYEMLEHFQASDFVGVVCDESSILKHFGGTTQKQVARFMAHVPYRLLCTATPAPNDYVELGTSSEALGNLGHSDMLSRFFRQVDNKTKYRMDDVRASFAKIEQGGSHFAKLAFRASQQIGQWRLKAHAEIPFWRWVASWGKACRKPSDLGFDDGGFILPPFKEVHHVVKARTPGDGKLFVTSAIGLGAEREERRRTLVERCEKVAELAEESQVVLIWCHLNIEAQTLENMIPYSIEVGGHHDDDYKETALDWFMGNYCVCNDRRFRARITSWQRSEVLPTGADTIESIVRRYCPEPSDTEPEILKNGKPISADTIKKIKGCGKEVRNKARASMPCAENDTPLTLDTAKKSKPKSDNGKKEIQKHDSAKDLGFTDSTSSRTKQSYPAKKENAPSAGEEIVETGEDSGSSSIIATEQGKSGDSSALIVITGSENSRTIPNAYKMPSCICGNQSGRRRLISKSRVFGWGLNMQHCAHVITFVTHSYESYYQAVRRCWRFGQKKPVRVDVISTEGESRVAENMARKSEQAAAMFDRILSHMNSARNIKAERTAIEQEVPEWL